MRKPRDFDAELKALNDKAKQLRDRKLVQLGELVIATGADSLAIEVLTGALLAAVETKDGAIKEGWRKSGATFFHRTSHSAAKGGNRGAGGDTALPGGAKPPAADAGPS